MSQISNHIRLVSWLSWLYSNYLAPRQKGSKGKRNACKNQDIWRKERNYEFLKETESAYLKLWISNKWNIRRRMETCKVDIIAFICPVWVSFSINLLSDVPFVPNVWKVSCKIWDKQFNEVAWDWHLWLLVWFLVALTFDWKRVFFSCSKEMVLPLCLPARRMSVFLNVGPYLELSQVISKALWVE